MSTKVQSWVWEHSTARDSRRLLHLALADEARDDGYLSGQQYGSTKRLETKCGFGSRQTIVDARDWLEVHGEILVRRPEDRGYGRHNEYVVLMGRDPNVVAASFGWSTTQTTAKTSRHNSSQRPRTTTVSSIANQPPSSAHRGADAAPPASGEQPATEPVDDASGDPAGWSEIQTIQNGLSVRGWSAHGLPDGALPTIPVLPNTPSHLTLAHRPEPGWGARVVDETSDVDPLELLRAELAALAPETLGVDWTQTARRRRELLEHLAAWPSADDAVPTWAEAALVSIARYGVPKFARAWRSVWLELNPPATAAGDVMCDDHALGELRVPVRICAPCRGARVLTAVS